MCYPHALLSSEYPERILPILLAQYWCLAHGTEDAVATITRMKPGEVLMHVTQVLGESTAMSMSTAVLDAASSCSTAQPLAALCHATISKG